MFKESSLPAVVRKEIKKRDIHYTVTVIGNAKDLKEWKLERSRVDAQYAVESAQRFQTRRANAIAMVEGKVTTPTSSDEEKSETQYLDEMSPKQIKLREVHVPQPIETKAESFFKKASKWALSFLNSAFEK